MKRVLGLMLVGFVCSMSLGCSGGTAAPAVAPVGAEGAEKRAAENKSYEQKMQEAAEKAREQQAGSSSGGPYGN